MLRHPPSAPKPHGGGRRGQTPPQEVLLVFSP